MAYVLWRMEANGTSRLVRKSVSLKDLVPKTEEIEPKTWWYINRWAGDKCRQVWNSTTGYKKPISPTAVRSVLQHRRLGFYKYFA